MANWKRDVIVSVSLLCAYVVFFIESIDLKKTARTYPQVLLILCAIFTFMLLVNSIRIGRKAEKKESDEAKKMELTIVRDIAILCVGMVAYILLIDILGYITSTVLYTAGAMVFLKIRKPIVIAGVSIGVALFLYFMFNNVLGILLPAGFLI